jgi:hypothetical protein
MEQKSIGEIMSEMEQDIHEDIYGYISGHEFWAEEIYRLREELRLTNDRFQSAKRELQHVRKQAELKSWSDSPDRMVGQFTDEEIARSRWGFGDA